MRLRRAFVFVLLCCPAASGQQANVQQQRPLRLAAEIAHRTYCSGGRGVDFLHLRVRLRYTNIGERKLILYQGHNLFFSVWVNPRPEQDTLANYELKTSAARFLTTGSEDVDRPTPTSAFVVLPPGGALSARLAVSAAL